MARSRSSSWRGGSGDSPAASPTPPLQRPVAPALTLDRVIGQVGARFGCACWVLDNTSRILCRCVAMCLLC